MVARGYSALSIVLAGTSGGYVGSLVNYRLAARGEQWWRERNPNHHERLDRMSRAFARWGPPLLVLSWLPVVGEALTVVGGFARVRLSSFSLWTITGRVVRMIVLVKLSRLFL
jgi:membrane protein YqaA with SNARE-associated domain